MIVRCGKDVVRDNDQSFDLSRYLRDFPEKKKSASGNLAPGAGTLCNYSL